jgi:molybdopterin-biosynthesis enzyme MoeA-like protein
MAIREILAEQRTFTAKMVVTDDKEAVLVHDGTYVHNLTGTKVDVGVGNTDLKVLVGTPAELKEEVSKLKLKSKEELLAKRREDTKLIKKAEVITK